MSIFMYDSTEANVLPAGKKAYAGYIGPPSATNRFVSFPAVAARFYPGAHCFSIAVHQWLMAACLDMENGDAKPEHFPNWWRMMRAHGQARPCGYAQASGWMPEVHRRMALAGIDRSEYRTIVADWDGNPVIPPGEDGKQFINHGPNGENYDISVVRDNFFVATKKRRPPKPPHPKVVGASAGAALGVGITAILKAAHVHITPDEAAAISTIGAAVSGYITPNKRNK